MGDKKSKDRATHSSPLVLVYLASAKFSMKHGFSTVLPGGVIRPLLRDLRATQTRAVLPGVRRPLQKRLDHPSSLALR